MQASLRVVAVAMLSLIAASSLVAAAAQRLAADLTGNWTFEVVTENGTGVSAVAMTQRGDSLTAAFGPQGPWLCGRRPAPLGCMWRNGGIVHRQQQYGLVMRVNSFNINLASSL